MKITIELNLENKDDAVKYKRINCTSELVYIIDTIVCDLKAVIENRSKELDKNAVIEKSSVTAQGCELSQKSTIKDLHDYVLFHDYVLKLLQENKITLEELY